MDVIGGRARQDCRSHTRWNSVGSHFMHWMFPHLPAEALTQPLTCWQVVCLSSGLGAGGAGQRKRVHDSSFACLQARSLLALGVNLIFLIPQMLVGRTRRRESSAKANTGMGTLRRRRRKPPMEKSRRTLSSAWRTGPKSSPRPPTPPWEARPPAATRWSWWHSTGRSCETHCSARITSPPACLLCVTRTTQAPPSP